MPIKIIKNLYNEFQEMRQEILKHKWIESEKAGRDVGFEFALRDWMKHHHKNWVKSKEKNKK